MLILASLHRRATGELTGECPAEHEHLEQGESFSMIECSLGIYIAYSLHIGFLSGDHMLGLQVKITVKIISQMTWPSDQNWICHKDASVKVELNHKNIYSGEHGTT